MCKLQWDCGGNQGGLSEGGRVEQRLKGFAQMDEAKDVEFRELVY